MAMPRPAQDHPRAGGARRLAMAAAAAALMAAIAATTQALLHPEPLVAQEAELGAAPSLAALGPAG